MVAELGLGELSSAKLFVSATPPSVSTASVPSLFLASCTDCSVSCRLLSREAGEGKLGVAEPAERGDRPELQSKLSQVPASECSFSSSSSEELVGVLPSKFSELFFIKEEFSLLFLLIRLKGIIPLSSKAKENVISS